MVKIWKVVWGFFGWDRATRRIVADDMRGALEKAEKLKMWQWVSVEITSIELESESDDGYDG